MKFLIFQLFITVIAFVLNYIGEVKETVKGETRQKTIDKRKKFKSISIILLVVIFFMSGTAQYFGYLEAEDALSEQERKHKKTNLKLDASSVKMDKALNNLIEVQNKATSIANSMDKQLREQEQINTKAKNLLLKNEQLLASQIRIYKNTDRSLNPMFPMDAFITTSFPMDYAKKESSYSKNYSYIDFENAISEIKQYLDSNSTNSIKGIAHTRDDKGKVNSLLIEDIDVISPSKSYAIKMWFNHSHEISFLKKSNESIVDFKFTLRNYDDRYNFAMKTYEEIGSKSSCTRRVNSLMVFYPKRIYMMSTTYYGCTLGEFPKRSKTILSMNDLVNYSFVVKNFGYGRNLVDFGLYAQAGASQNLLIWLNEKDKRRHDKGDGYDYYHGIKHSDLNGKRTSLEAIWLSMMEY